MQYQPIPENLELAGKQLIDSAFKVHQALGPGLLESVYEECLFHELRKRGLSVERQKEIPIRYDGKILSTRLKIDLMVENGIVVELKAVETLVALFHAQLLLLRAQNKWTILDRIRLKIVDLGQLKKRSE